MAAPFTTVNWIDAPGVTFTPVIGTMSRDLDELAIAWGDGLARGTYAGVPTIVFDVDLGLDRRIMTLGIAGMNGTCSVQFRLTSDGGADGDVLATTAVEYQDEWGYPFGPACWLHAPGGVPWEARYLRVRIDITSGVGATWVDARRLWVGDGVLIPEGVDRQFSLDFVDGTPSERSPRGRVAVDEEARWRKVKYAVTRRSTETLLFSGAGAGLWPLLASVGRAREVVIGIRANEPFDSYTDQARYVQTVLGQVVEWTPLVSSAGELWGIDSMTVEEAPMQALS